MSKKERKKCTKGTFILRTTSRLGASKSDTGDARRTGGRGVRQIADLHRAQESDSCGSIP